MSLKTLLATAFCLIGAGWLVFSLNKVAPSIPAPTVVTMAASRGKSIYESIPINEIPPDEDSIRALLRTAPAMGAESVGEERYKALLDETAEFLYERFVKEDPRAYYEWRLSKGYLPQARSFLEEWWSVSAQYTKHGGEGNPSQITDEKIFEHLWISKRRSGEGFNLLTSLASGAEGWCLAFGDMTPGNPTRRLLECSLSSDTWHGAISSTHCAWFEAPRPYKQRLRDGEPVQYASVGVIGGYADGSRRPLVMTFVWDDLASRWDLQILNTNNEPSLKLLSIDY